MKKLVHPVDAYFLVLHNPAESGKVDDFRWQTVSDGVLSI
jgi:hypothetical protein